MNLGNLFRKLVGKKTVDESGYWAEKNAREKFQAARLEALRKHPARRMILLKRNQQAHADSMAFFRARSHRR